MPFSTNPGCMEAGGYGLTTGMCFLAYRLELDAVARAAVDSVVCFGWGAFFPFFFRYFLSSKSHGLLQVRGHLSSFTSLLVLGSVQGVII